LLSLFEQFDDIEVSTQGKSNEWYTPAKYIEAARKVMGGIDLDPASCEDANKIVQAQRYYTESQNGLTQDWTCTSMWLNPPYGSTLGIPGRTGNLEGLTKPFVLKLVDDYERGNITQAVLCVTTDTDAKWFIPLWSYLICFATHKVMFHRPGQSNSGQFYGTCFVYLGSNEQAFIDIFSEFGRIAKAIDTPKSKPIMRSLWE
jgi:hypothetical protein